MANLNGQNIGTNYKGIINIGSTVNQNVSASLQSLTDGDGNNLPLQLATGLIGIQGGTINFTTGTNTRDVFSQSYTVNNTGGTNTITGIKVNATETSITGTTHNLMDLQVGGVSAFRVDRVGTTALNSITSNSWILQFTDSGSNFLLHRGSNRFKVTSAGVTVMIGSAFIGADVINPSARLHVRGDGTNPILRLENSGGTEVFGVNNLGQLTQSITILGGITGGYGAFSIAYTGGVANNFNSESSSVRLGMYVTHSGVIAAAGIDYRSFGAGSTFSPTSGTGTYITALLNPIINQTGTANGITRGLYVNPTLTAAADFRAIEVKAGSTPAHKLLLLTDGSGNKVFEVNGKQEVGFFGSTPSGKLDVTGSRSNPEQALASLLTALATYGIIVDATTA